VGRGLIRGIVTFPLDDHYRSTNATWGAISALSLVSNPESEPGFEAVSLAVRWAKLENDDKVRHIMTQMAGLIALAQYYFCWLMNS
jgi:hypothetical protein